MSTDQRFALPPLWFRYRKESHPVSLFTLTTDRHSIGSAAIFLLGGTTRDVEPIPILLRSGDVVIMSGPECRRAYHGQSIAPHLEPLQAENIQRRAKNFGGHNSATSNFRYGRARLGTLQPIHQDDEDQSERSTGVPQKFPTDLVIWYSTTYSNTSATS